MSDSKVEWIQYFQAFRKKPGEKKKKKKLCSEKSGNGSLGYSQGVISHFSWISIIVCSAGCCTVTQALYRVTRNTPKQFQEQSSASDRSLKSVYFTEIHLWALSMNNGSISQGRARGWSAWEPSSDDTAVCMEDSAPWTVMSNLSHSFDLLSV